MLKNLPTCRRITAMLALFVLCVASLVVVPSTAQACTTVIVGRDASADGSRIIARTVDAKGNEAVRMTSVAAQQRAADWTFTDPFSKFTCTLPANSCQYIGAPLFTSEDAGSYYESCINEKNVCMSATESIYGSDQALAADPLVEDSICESNMPELVIPYVSSAREGVERLGALVEQHGISEESAVVFADDNETWYMEIYSGHQWAAIRFPDDSYAVIGNDGLIGAVDVNDTANVLVSSNLVALARDNGFLQEEDGKINLVATYCAPTRDYSQIRVWGGHRQFSPSQTGEYDVNETYRLLMKPDDKISLEDVLEFTRYRFEDTEFNVNEHPEVRAVGVVRTEAAHAFWLRDGKPQIMWEALANPEMSVYVPTYGNITQFSEAYAKDTYDTDETTAYWKLRRLSTLAIQGRDTYGAIVRDTWKQLEREFIAGTDARDARYEASGKSGEEAAAIFDELSDRAMGTADNLFDATLAAMAEEVTHDGSSDTSDESYADLVAKIGTTESASQEATPGTANAAHEISLPLCIGIAVLTAAVGALVGFFLSRKRTKRQ